MHLEAARGGGVPATRAREASLTRVIDMAIQRRRAAATLQFDPVVIRLLAEQEPFQQFLTRLYGVLLGDADDEGRVSAAMLSGAIGTAVVHPLVTDIDDDELRAQLLLLTQSSSRTTGVSAPMPVALSFQDTIALLHLGDDENRFSPEFLDEFDSHLDDAISLGASGLVTVATGKFYSNGLDLDLRRRPTATRPSGMSDASSRCRPRMLTLPVPTAAALSGHSFGVEQGCGCRPRGSRSSRGRRASRGSRGPARASPPRRSCGR